MSSCVKPDTHVALQLRSGMLKVVKMVPNSSITLPKVGIIPTNLLLGRPFYHTYELVDSTTGDDFEPVPDSATSSTTATKPASKKNNKRTNKMTNRACRALRIVPSAELNQEALGGREECQNGTDGGPADHGSDLAPSSSSTSTGVGDGVRTNRLTIDDSSRQQLTMDEIEALKQASGTDSGRTIIESIKRAHIGLDEKTDFSLAKYTDRKERKYLRRFVLLPLDAALLADYLIEREPGKMMELRRESLALVACWANVRAADPDCLDRPHGRWLAVEDTGGLIVAGMAEKMGILHCPEVHDDSESESDCGDEPVQARADQSLNPSSGNVDPSNSDCDSDSGPDRTGQQTRNGVRARPIEPMSATSNTITLVHANAQPNIGLLQYFGFNPNSISTAHPLFTHLHTLSWLQLVDPASDAGYAEPETLPDVELAGLKSNRRSTYFRKRRRWDQVRRVVDLARAGGHDGLVVATTLDIAGVLRRTLPLVRGGAPVVIFASSIEPLVAIADLFNKDRKSAWLSRLHESSDEPDSVSFREDLETEFGLDPTCLLAPTIQTVRARQWQVLPGRTHPVMTARGGADGYILIATRVVAHDGLIKAKGVFSKKRKTD